MATLFNSNIRCIEIRIFPVNSNKTTLFNSNIRCIEIESPSSVDFFCLMFNSNIRCIEILHSTNPNLPNKRLIVTLDVLILHTRDQVDNLVEFNSNIRCIEMF